MTMYDGWEEFYTNSKVDEDLVDKLSVNTKKKRYTLYENIDSINTDWVDEDDNYYDSTYVSREIFDIMLAGIKEKKYVRLIEEVEDDEEDED